MPEIVRSGLPRSFIDDLAVVFKVPVSQLVALLPVSWRTIQQLNADDALDDDTSDKLFQIAKVYVRALELFEDPKKVIIWFSSTCPYIGEKPFTLLGTQGGIEVVMDELARIEYGSGT